MLRHSAFQDVLARAARLLRSEGFRRSGKTFYLESDEAWGLINLQGSTTSSPERVRFVGNMGVASKRLADHEGIVSPPSIEQTHWRTRVGVFLHGNDVWWELDDETDVDQLGRLVCSEVAAVVPEVRRLMSDRALKEMWSHGRSEGLTRIQRLMNLSTLNALMGEKAALEETLVALRDEADRVGSSQLARAHVEELRRSGLLP